MFGEVFAHASRVFEAAGEGFEAGFTVEGGAGDGAGGEMLGQAHGIRVDVQQHGALLAEAFGEEAHFSELIEAFGACKDRAGAQKTSGVVEIGDGGQEGVGSFFRIGGFRESGKGSEEPLRQEAAFAHIFQQRKGAADPAGTPGGGNRRCRRGHAER